MGAGVTIDYGHTSKTTHGNRYSGREIRFFSVTVRFGSVRHRPFNRV